MIDKMKCPKCGAGQVPIPPKLAGILAVMRDGDCLPDILARLPGTSKRGLAYQLQKLAEAGAVNRVKRGPVYIYSLPK